MAPGAPHRGRYPALDGLRGAAAAVVVLFHTLLLWRPFHDPADLLEPDQVAWWMTHTPLYLVWAGPQAVFVFFVLSGFVLALPALTRPVRWRAYFPRRLLRLYLPVWASLVLAVGLAELFPRTSQPSLSEWYAFHERAVPLAEVVHDAVLVLGTGWLNGPLWSLRWEVLFSLLLPLYLVGGRVLRGRLLLLKLAILLVMIGGAWAAGLTYISYMSMFAVGVLLAFEVERVGQAARAVATASRASGPAVAVLTGLLLSSEFVAVMLDSDAAWLDGLLVGCQVAGAGLLVVLAMHWRPLVDWMTTPALQWLGVRSFSLYLVHEPVLVSVAVVAPRLPPLLMIPLVGLACVGVTWIFFRVVELPSHRLSRQAGAWADRPRTTRPARAADREPPTRIGAERA